MKLVLRGLVCLTLALSACSRLPEPEGPAPSAPVVATPVPAPVTTTAPPPSTGFEPVGSYDFSADFQGQSQPGVITITRAIDGKLGATLVGGNGEQLAASSVAVEGRKVTITATIPNGPEIIFALNFETNDKFSGTLGVQGMSGTVTGTRKKA